MIEIEFANRSGAASYRDDYPDLLADADDGREKTLRLVDEAPESVVEDARTEAQTGIEERRDIDNSTGQIPLTDTEKDRVGPFTGDKSLFHAMATKGVLVDEGVGDWVSLYDPDLGPEEHLSLLDRSRELANRGVKGMGKSGHNGPGDIAQGDRKDIKEERGLDRARSAEKARAESCNHAEGACKMGKPKACEHLRERCGYDDDSIESLIADGAGIEAISDPTPEPRETPDAPAAVTESSGDVDMGPRPNYGALPGPAQGAIGRSWGGYQNAVRSAFRSIERLEDDLRNAEEAAAAINGIETEHLDRQTDDFGRLRELHDRLSDLVDRHRPDDHGQPEPDADGDPDDGIPSPRPDPDGDAAITAGTDPIPRPKPDGDAAITAGTDPIPRPTESGTPAVTESDGDLGPDPSTGDSPTDGVIGVGPAPIPTDTRTTDSNDRQLSQPSVSGDAVNSLNNLQSGDRVAIRYSPQNAGGAIHDKGEVASVDSDQVTVDLDNKRSVILQQSTDEINVFDAQDRIKGRKASVGLLESADALRAEAAAANPNDDVLSIQGRQSGFDGSTKEEQASFAVSEERSQEKETRIAEPENPGGLLADTRANPDRGPDINEPDAGEQSSLGEETDDADDDKTGLAGFDQ